MALEVFVRIADLGDVEQPAPFFIYNGAKWSAIQHLLSSYYGDICPDNLDVRYWDEEDYVILSSQEELEEAIRLAKDKSYLQLLVRLMDPTGSGLSDQQPAPSFSVDTAVDGGKPLEKVPQRTASKAGSPDCSTPENTQPTSLEEVENIQSTLDTAPEQQNTSDSGGATAMDSDGEHDSPKKALKKKALKQAAEGKADPSPSENNQVLDFYLKYLGQTASQPDAAASMMEKFFEAVKVGEESADQEPTMLPGALSGANAIAIEMPEMEHHGTETAEPAEIAETGEVSTESSRDAETGFWMQPRLEAEVSAELRRRLSTLVTEKEHSQYTHLQKKHEHRSGRKDKKKKHRTADTSSEDMDHQKKGKSSSSPTSSNLMETMLKQESSSDTPPALVQPGKKHEKHERRSGNKSDSKKRKHSTDPLTEDSFIRYMTKFEAQLKKDMAKKVAKKTVLSVIKSLPKHSEGSETTSSPPAVSMKGAGFVHEDIICDCCDREIVGTRYICGNCPNYDLCEECEDIQPPFHDPTHVFIKLRRPCLKAGTRHGVRVPLLKRVIYDTKEEERKMDPDRIQVIIECMKGHGGQSRNSNEDDKGEELNDQQSESSAQEEEQEERQLCQTEEHSHRVCKLDLTEPTGCVDGPPEACNPRTSMAVPLDLTKKTEPLENKECEPGFRQYCPGDTEASLIRLIVAGYGCEDPTASMLPDHSSLRSPAETEESVWVPAVKPEQQQLREVSQNGSDKEEDADDDQKLIFEDGFVVCPVVQTCFGKQETCIEEKQVDGPSRRETSPASSIEVVDSEPTAVSQAATAHHQCSSQQPHELKEGENGTLKEMSFLFEEWLNRNHSDIQEESEDASSFTSLSDGVSSDEDFVVITPDCFDTSKPLDPNHLSVLCKKAERWNTVGKQQKEDGAHSNKKENKVHSYKQEELLFSVKQEEDEPVSSKQDEDESSLNITPPAAVFDRLPETIAFKVTSESTAPPAEMDDASGDGTAEKHHGTFSKNMPPCSSPVREVEVEKNAEEEEDGAKEEEERTTPLQGEIPVPAGAEPDVNQNVTSTAAVSHNTAEREEPSVEQQASEEPLMKGQVSEEENCSVDDPTEEDVEDPDDDDDDDDADIEETDLKCSPRSDEEGAAAASDSLDPNQQLNQMMTNTLKKASSGLQTLFQTGRDIFRTFQQADSYEYKESSYQFKPSDYKLPESTWKPSSKEYVPPKSNFQLVESEYQIPKSTYTGPRSQVPAGVGLVGEYTGPLQRIREMGYFNNEHILVLLKKHEGDVQKVVNELVEETDNSWAEQRHGQDHL